MGGASTRSVREVFGSQFSGGSYHVTKLRRKSGRGWAAFAKREFTPRNRRIRLKYRMRLFQASVEPCVLRGSGAWALTMDHQRHLRSTRRMMLRMIVGARRRHDACWVDYIERATAAALDLAGQFGAHDWARDSHCDNQQNREICRRLPMGDGTRGSWSGTLRTLRMLSDALDTGENVGTTTEGATERRARPGV